ncbi:MAG: hypothetical protein PUC01_05070 [Spirochaetales bacterium]|nr:hypothetical protein [Spirochaetales bacterium]
MTKDRLDMSLEYYEMAIKKAKEGSKREAVKLYTRTFFIRCADNFQDLVFCDFFALQFLKYIKTKKQLIMSLPEGDMVSDLIKDTYLNLLCDIEDSVFNITSSGKKNILKNIEIHFPCQNDTKCSSF